MQRRGVRYVLALELGEKKGGGALANKGRSLSVYPTNKVVRSRYLLW